MVYFTESVLSRFKKFWYGGYVLDFRPGGPGSIPGVDVNMN